MSLPKSRGVELRGTAWGEGLKPAYARGFVYSDCWVDDARLVILNIKAAQAKGAAIYPRHRFLGAERRDGLWRIDLENQATGARQAVTARGLVNAAGPWVGALFGQLRGIRSGKQVRLVKGSHIVVPRQHKAEHAFILQNRDNRIVFVIPYERDFSLIGTTDLAYQGDPAAVQIEPQEIEYLSAIASEYLAHPVAPADVVWTYSGVRPLYDDGSDNPSAVTRDYVFELDDQAGALPLLSIYGGKITTYRELAERAMHRLKPFYPGMGADWTADAVLPGGDLGSGDFDTFVAGLIGAYPALPADYLRVLARRHGANCAAILGAANVAADLGQYFGGHFFEAELEYLMREEFAVAAEDALWRRTKEGLHMDGAGRAAVAAWMEAHRRNA